MLLRLHYCVYVIEDFVVMSCNILLAIFCLRYFAYTQITHLSQNDCITNIKVYSIPTFWQNEGIAHKKHSSIPTFWQKRAIETSEALATSHHSFRRSQYSNAKFNLCRNAFYTQRNPYLAKH